MKRIPALDGLRGLAILFVLVWHYFVLIISAPPGGAVDLIRHIFGFAWTGVDLFFVLSGFLIAGILIDNREAPRYFRTFYIRRVCRILPLYFCLVGSYILLRNHLPFTGPIRQWLLGDPLPLWSYATLTQNIVMGHTGSNGPNWLTVTWSLAIEEQFYLVFPWIVFLTAPRILPTVVGLGVILAFALRAAYPGMHCFLETQYRMDSLLIGVLLAWLVRRKGWSEMAKRSRWALALAAGAGGAGAVVWFFRNLATTQIGFLDRAGPIGFTIVAALYGLFLLLVLDDTCQPGRALTWKPLTWFGRRSYAIYLMHEALLGIGFGYGVYGGAPFFRAHPVLAVWLSILGPLAATLGLAEISHRFFESPIVGWGRRFHYYNQSK